MVELNVQIFDHPQNFMYKRVVWYFEATHNGENFLVYGPNPTQADVHYVMVGLMIESLQREQAHLDNVLRQKLT